MSEDDVAREIALRHEFFRSRVDGALNERDARDLTDMTTNDAAAICECECGVLVRLDPMRTAVRFAEDEYDTQTLEALYALHTATFTSRTNVRDLLPSGSRVLEIGSYCGGFLEAARRWGWNATGVDIGRDTSAFAKSKGFDVTTERFERCDFADESFDGVFIWSCFEQLPEPAVVLDRVRAISKPGAPLGIYIPDAAMYAEVERAFAKGEPRDEKSPCVHLLAYNNLLGFPHRFGYTLGALNRLVKRHGFELHSAHRLPAIRPLRNRLTKAAREEEARVEPAWIEAIFAREH